jgi:hypothetical protein
MIMFVGLFAGAFAYYQGVVVPSVAPVNGGCPTNFILVGNLCKTDPFAVIWDGQVPGSISTFTPGYVSTHAVNDCSDGGGGPTCLVSGVTDQVGDFLMAHVGCNGRSGGVFTVTDSQGNVWHQLSVLDNHAVWYTPVTHTGSDTVTAHDSAQCVVFGNPGGQMSVDRFQDVVGIGNAATFPQWVQTQCYAVASVCSTHAPGGTMNINITVAAGDTLMVMADQQVNNAFFGPQQMVVSDSMGSSYSFGPNSDNSPGCNSGTGLCEQLMGTLHVPSSGLDTVHVSFTAYGFGVQWVSSATVTEYSGVQFFGSSSTTAPQASPISTSLNVQSKGSLDATFFTGQVTSTPGGPTTVFVAGAANTRCNAGTCSGVNVALGGVQSGDVLVVSVWRCCAGNSQVALASGDMTDGGDTFTLRGDSSTLTSGTGATVISDGTWTTTTSQTGTVTFTLSNSVDANTYTALTAVNYRGASIGVGGGFATCASNVVPNGAVDVNSCSITTTNANSIVVATVNGNNLNGHPPYTLTSGSMTNRFSTTNGGVDGADVWDGATTTAGTYTYGWTQGATGNGAYYMSAVLVELQSTNTPPTNVGCTAQTAGPTSTSDICDLNAFGFEERSSPTDLASVQSNAWTFTFAGSATAHQISVELMGEGSVMDHTFFGGTPYTTNINMQLENPLVGSTMYEGFLIQGSSSSSGCVGNTYHSGQIEVMAHCQSYGLGNNEFHIYTDYSSQASLTPSMSITGTVSNPTPPETYEQFDVQLLFGTVTGCTGSQTVDIGGYLCENAHFTGGMLGLDANATTQGIAISKGAIDLSQCSAKACAFANGFCAGGSSCTAAPLSSFHVGDRFAWGLTANSTLPTQRGYNPINDQAMALLVYCVVQGADKINCYVYMQRQPGQLPLQSVGDDPYPSCNYALTLFRCMNVPTNKVGGSNGDNLVANYTGGNTGAGNTGGSYWCGGSVASGPDTCAVGGKGFIADQNQGTISYPGYNFNQTLFPWLNVQNNYHMMFWSHAGNPNYEFFTQANSNGGIISYYVPPTSPASPTTDTGGFFGWVGRSLGGAWNSFTGIAGGIINSVAGPVMNFGNSFLSVIISGFVQSLSIFILALQTVLNAVGQFLHLGNIGDAFVSFMTFLGTAITQLLTAIYNFFALLGAILVGGYFTFITGVLTLVPSLIAFAFIIWNLVFSGTFSIDALLFLDFAYGTIETAEHGLKGFFGWIMLNTFIITFPFDAAWRVYDIATRGIHRTKETADPVG